MIIFITFFQFSFSAYGSKCHYFFNDPLRFSIIEPEPILLISDVATALLRRGIHTVLEEDTKSLILFDSEDPAMGHLEGWLEISRDFFSHDIAINLNHENGGLGEFFFLPLQFVKAVANPNLSSQQIMAYIGKAVLSVIEKGAKKTSDALKNNPNDLILVDEVVEDEEIIVFLESTSLQESRQDKTIHFIIEPGSRAYKMVLVIKDIVKPKQAGFDNKKDAQIALNSALHARLASIFIMIKNRSVLATVDTRYLNGNLPTSSIEETVDMQNEMMMKIKSLMLFESDSTSSQPN